MEGKNYSTQARPTPGVRGGQELFDTGQAYTRGTLQEELFDIQARPTPGVHGGQELFDTGWAYTRSTQRAIII